MSINTQGSEIYAIDPRDNSLIDVGCVNSIDGIDSTLSQNDVTCLRDKDKQYEAGIGDPGSATMEIRFDPSDPNHIKLHEIYVARLTLKWTIGFSDGTGTAPTVDGDDFTLPDTRSWLVFNGYIAGFPFSFAQNTKVTSSLPIQISGAIVPVPRASKSTSSGTSGSSTTTQGS